MCQSSINFLLKIFVQNGKIMNKFILQYILDYPAIHLPERDFLFGVVGTNYPDEMLKLVENHLKFDIFMTNKEESE